MTELNKQALREVAEKALPATKRLLMMPNDELFDEVLLNVDGDVDAANAFNLLAGPETVLALLDELEAAENNLIDSECHVAEVGESLRDKQALLEAAENTSEARKQALIRSHKMFQRQMKRAVAAEKRIAELEARKVTVKLPADYRNDDGSINADMLNTCAVVGAFRDALAAAGISLQKGYE